MWEGTWCLPNGMEFRDLGYAIRSQQFCREVQVGKHLVGFLGGWGQGFRGLVRGHPECCFKGGC
jgi:hypothetical protein